MQTELQDPSVSPSGGEIIKTTP